VLLLNLCLLAVAGEIGLRAVAALRPSVLLARADAGVEQGLEAARYPPGTVRHGFPVNSGGHYDEEFAPKVPGAAWSCASATRSAPGSSTTASTSRPSPSSAWTGSRSTTWACRHRHSAVPAAARAGGAAAGAGCGHHQPVRRNDLSWPLPAPETETSLKGWFDASSLLMIQVPRCGRPGC